jgi:hypothetical protein
MTKEDLKSAMDEFGPGICLVISEQIWHEVINEALAGNLPISEYKRGEKKTDNE